MGFLQKGKSLSYNFARGKFIAFSDIVMLCRKFELIPTKTGFLEILPNSKIGFNCIYIYVSIILTFRDIINTSNGAKTCHLDSDALPLQPIWGWVNESNYTGHAGYMDIWTSKVILSNK